MGTWRKVILGTGTSSQYIKGDGSFGTYSSGVGLGDANTWTAVNKFSTHVGIGVSPESDWKTNVIGLQVGAGGSIFARSDSGETKIFIAENVKWNSTGYQRINDGYSAMHQMDGGAHTFAVAGTDDADTTVSFTNALILSNTGSATFAGTINTTVNSTSIIGDLKNSHASGYGLKIQATDANSARYIATFNDKDDNVKARIMGNGHIEGRSLYVTESMEIRKDTGELYFSNTANSKYFRIRRLSDTLVFDRYDSNTVTALTINSDGSSSFGGNVDIGARVGTGLFEVQGSVNNDWAGRFENTNSGGYGGLFKVDGTTSGELVLQARADTNNILTILGDGSSTFSGDVKIENSSASAKMEFKRTSSSTSNYILQAYSGVFELYDLADSREIWRAKDDGTFAIAQNTTFAGELDVNPATNKRIKFTFPTDEYANESRIGFSDLNAHITYKASNNFMEIWSYNSLFLQTGSSATTALTIDSSQNATFAKHIILPNTYSLQWGDANARIEGSTSNDTVSILTSGRTALTINSSQETFIGDSDNGKASKLFLRGYGVSDGTGVYGSYGWLELKSNNNYTGGARTYALTNAYQTAKFAILAHTHSTSPALTTSGEVASGTSVPFILDYLGNATFGSNTYIGDNKSYIAGSGSDFTLRHSGSHAYLDNITGNVYYRQMATGNHHIFQTITSGANTTRFEITDGGTYTTGSAIFEDQLIINRTGTGANSWDIMISHFGSSDYGSLFFDSNASTGNFYIRDSSNNVDFAVTGAGNVGIGTASPDQALLQIDGSTAGEVAGIAVRNNNNTQDNLASIYFGTYSASVTAKISAKNRKDVETAGSELVFFTRGTSGSMTEKMVIEPDGNVGIGSSVPLSLIHAKGSSTGAVQAFIHNSNGATNSSADLAFGTWSGAIPTGTGNPGPQAKISAINTNSGTASTDLAFSTYGSSGTSSEKMRITNEGNVGIGIASSIDKKLHIASSTSTDGIMVEQSGTGSAMIHFKADGSNRGFVGVDDSNGGAILSSTAGSDYIMCLRSEQEMHFGTNGNNVALQLDSSQNATFAGDVSLNSAITLGVSGLTNGKINTPEAMYFNIDSDASQTDTEFVWGCNRTADTGGTELMRLTESGKLGIGTNNPSSPAGVGTFLHIANTAHAGVVLDDTNSTAYEMYSADGHMYFYSESASDNTVIIKNDGNVGIGTTTPTSAVGVAKFLSISDAGSAGIVLEDTNAGDWEIYNTGGDLYFNTGGDKVKLDTSGNAIFYGDATFSESLTVSKAYPHMINASCDFKGGSAEHNVGFKMSSATTATVATTSDIFNGYTWVAPFNTTLRAIYATSETAVTSCQLKVEVASTYSVYVNNTATTTTTYTKSFTTGATANVACDLSITKGNAIRFSINPNSTAVDQFLLTFVFE